MYTGSNPSALRSMEWIRTALLRMLEQEKYDCITIKEICQQADLSRQTFYQMFSSKDEVIQYHFSTLFHEFEKKCGSSQNDTLSNIARHFFSFFYEQRDFVQILITNHLAFLLEQQFEVYLRKITLFRDINDKELHGDYTTAYIAGALTQVLIHWFKHSFDLSVDELSRLVTETITGKYVWQLHADCEFPSAT